MSELLIYSWEVPAAHWTGYRWLPVGWWTVWFYFENQALDVSRRELSRDGETILVEPKVFDLLVYLIENRERLVTKDDLIAHVWEGRIVSDSALTSAIHAARKAVGDSGQDQRLIRTGARKGFRFVGSVRLHARAEPAPGPAAAASSTNEPALPLPDKPSIAVLPFHNIGDDSEQEYFADGMVEEIITALSRTKALFVIARNSSFAYKGKSPDSRQVGHDLGVRYVLEGSVRKAGDRVRITGQLIDASSGAHIWASRFEGGLDDIFELQDQVTSQVMAAIAPAVERAEIERSRVKPPKNLQAYDYYLRGLSQVALFTNEANDLALVLFRKAMSLEPSFAWPYGRAAACYHHRRSWGWATDPARETIEAERLARQAIALDNRDPKVLTDAGWVLAYIVGRLEEGRALLDQAIEIDPNNSGTWNYRGWVEWALGGTRGVDYFARALRHNPVDVRHFGAQSGMANALFRIGRNEEALSWVEKVVLHYPGFLPTHWASMAANAALGRVDEARAAYETYRRIHPAARISNIRQWMPTITDEVSAMYFTGFRIAGMPD